MDKDIQRKLIDHFANGNITSYRKGTMLVFGGNDPTCVWWLKEGVVEQYDITPEGNRVTVNIFKPPAFFPMSWAINMTPNSYFFEALTDVTVQCRDAEATVAFVQANPDVLFDLLSRVYRGTDALLRRLVLAVSGIATSRLVFELIIEAYRFGRQTDDPTILLITARQGVLASRCGLARETVSRELHKLQAEGLVVLTPAGILLDPARLEKKL